MKSKPFFLTGTFPKLLIFCLGDRSESFHHMLSSTQVNTWHVGAMGSSRAASQIFPQEDVNVCLQQHVVSLTFSELIDFGCLD